MTTSRPVLLALAVLGLGLAPLPAGAAPPERPSPVQADDDQQQEALLERALEDEEAFRGQRARLLRLHALAWEDNDTKRVTDLERLLKRLYSRHLRKMNEHRRHLKGAWRDRLEDHVVERRERAEERHEAQQGHREERHEARQARHEERHEAGQERHEARTNRRAERHRERGDRRDERQAVRSDGRAERRESRAARRAQPRDGQAPTMTDHAAKREPAAPRRIDPNGEPVRLDGASDRRPARRATHLDPGPDGQRVGAALGKRRPVPPARPAPGPGRSATMSGGMTGAAKKNSHRGSVGRAPAHRLSSRRETETRAAASINRKNAEAEYRRLLREIESEND